MQTIKNTVTSSFREKGSKFIGYLFSAPSPEEFDTQLRKIKTEFPDATHHCYAWRMHPHNLTEFSQDDGEPSGTAGLPILNRLKSYEAVNTACVIVRYYGGTKLGKTGLIQAYGGAADECLRQAEFVTMVPIQKFQISYPYNQQKQIDQLKNSFDLKETKSTYGADITLTLACRISRAEEFERYLQKLDHLGIKSDKEETGFLIME